MDNHKIKIFLITITVILVMAILGTAYSLVRKNNNKSSVTKPPAEELNGVAALSQEELLNNLPSPTAGNSDSAESSVAEIEKKNTELLAKLPDPPASTETKTAGAGSPNTGQASVLSKVSGKVVDIINKDGKQIVKVETKTANDKSNIVEYALPAGSTLLVSVGDTVTNGSVITKAGNSTSGSYGKTPEELLNFLPAPK